MKSLEILIEEFHIEGRSVWTITINGRATTHATPEEALHAMATWAAQNIERGTVLRCAWRIATHSGHASVLSLYAKVNGMPGATMKTGAGEWKS